MSLELQKKPKLILPTKPKKTNIPAIRHRKKLGPKHHLRIHA